MKLIINISEATQKIIHDHGEVGIHMSAEKLLEAIQDSIPLPKGHGRLIDADKLTENILCQTFGLRSVDIDNAPTIIEADKKRNEK